MPFVSAWNLIPINIRLVAGERLEAINLMPGPPPSTDNLVGGSDLHIIIIIENIYIPDNGCKNVERMVRALHKVQGDSASRGNRIKRKSKCDNFDHTVCIPRFPRFFNIDFSRFCFISSFRHRCMVVIVCPLTPLNLNLNYFPYRLRLDDTQARDIF